MVHLFIILANLIFFAVLIMLAKKQKTTFISWVDISDMNTLFQDTEGKIPVTQSGQKVGLVKCKVGGMDWITSKDASSRPIYISDENESYLILNKRGMI